jgi:hypothetical protein
MQPTPTGHVPPNEGLSRARSRRHDLRKMMEGLELAVAGPAGEPDHWLGSVESALVDLRQALDAHITEAESTDGLLAEIIALDPRLAVSADQLRSEHGDLLRAWERAYQILQDEPTPDRSKIRRRVVSLLGRLALHRQAGADLVYEAYNVDIGGRG